MTSASTQPEDAGAGPEAPKAWGYRRPNGEVVVPAHVEPGDLVRVWFEAELVSGPGPVGAVSAVMRISEVLSRFTVTRARARGRGDTDAVQ